ncbi:BNR-4 repeat-containing protein [Glaciecola sp. SC05]|uniref:BNR-4 repeat-containing protein n=1 Tax=Glaciecola sp. SC05 TaxID=1987355 RepID=UPI00352970A9
MRIAYPFVYYAAILFVLFTHQSHPVYAKVSERLQAKALEYFTENGLSNAVSPTQHPAGEYVNGITYLTYQGLLEDPYVAAYNHLTKRWSGPYKAGVSDMGKDPSRKIDNHGKPALIIDDLGYIHIVFGGHGGVKELGKNTLGNYHYGRQQNVVSKRPYDISEWEVLNNVSPFGTYNQWIKMDNGDLYLFYRHGAHRSDWVYQKSTDHGRSFSQPVSVLKTLRRDDVKGTDSWYGWFGKGEGDTIVATYSYHICWDTNADHQHTGERLNGYFMQMDTISGQWFNVKGEPVATPIDRNTSNQKTLVLDSGIEWSNHTTTQLDQNGHPHMIFAKGPHLGRKHGGPKYPNYYRWDGEQWRVGQDNQIPVAQGSLMVSSDKHSSALLAHKSNKGEGQVSWWHTFDGGQSFEQGKILLTQANATFAITSLIRNAHPDAQVIVAAKVNGTDLRKMYLLGASGPVYRPASEVMGK